MKGGGAPDGAHVLALGPSGFGHFPFQALVAPLLLPGRVKRRVLVWRRAWVPQLAAAGYAPGVVIMVPAAS